MNSKYNNGRIVKNKKTTYENFEAECPHCKKWNIFNRASDLKTFKPIAGLDVLCCFCNKTFRIGFDCINENYQQLLFSANEFFERKQYIQVVINICIAYEMFFSKILKEYIVEKFKTENINKKISNAPFGTLFFAVLNLFLYIEKIKFDNLEDYINHCFDKNININKFIEELKMLKNKEIKKFLLPLICLYKRKKTINYLRNKVAHKQAYRPTKEEAKMELERAKIFIYGLQNIMKF